MAGTIMTQEAFNAALASGKYSKTWLTNTMKRMQEHETKLAIMNWFATDEEAKYFLGVALGAGAGIAGSVLGDLTGYKKYQKMDPNATGNSVWVPGDPSKLTFEQQQSLIDYANEHGLPVQSAETYWAWSQWAGYGKYITVPNTDEEGNPIPWSWLLGGFALGGVGGAGLGYLAGSGTAGPLTSPFSFIPDLLLLGGVGFAGFCGAVLILKAIFSGTDLGELMTGAGEIIPL